MGHEIQHSKVTDNAGQKLPALDANQTNYFGPESSKDHAAAFKPANEAAQGTVNRSFPNVELYDSAKTSIHAGMPGANPSSHEGLGGHGTAPGGGSADSSARAGVAGAYENLQAAGSGTTVGIDRSASGGSVDFDKHPNIYTGGGAAAPQAGATKVLYSAGAATGEGSQTNYARASAGIDAGPSSSFTPEIQNAPPRAREGEHGAAPNDSTTESKYSLADGNKLDLTFPNPEALSKASANDLKQMFGHNQAALTEMMQHSGNSLPILAFHGSDQTGMKKITTERSGTSKDGDPSRFYVATISKKADDAKTLLADYTRAANFAACYGQKGGVAVLDISNKIKNGVISSVTEHPGFSPNLLQADLQHSGETTVNLDHDNFDKVFKGVVTPAQLHRYELPFDKSSVESYNRAIVAKGLNEQSILVQALQTGGVLQPMQ